MQAMFWVQQLVFIILFYLEVITATGMNELNVAQRWGSSSMINFQVHLTSNGCKGYD